MAEAAFTEPNLYDLSGRHLHVTYSTTGITGQPQFSYQDQHQAKSFIGSEISRVETDAGALVSVTLQLSPDRGGTTFSVLIPRVNLVGDQPQSIRTDGITTLHKFSLVPMSGQQDFYTIIRLAGSASRVFF